MTVNPFEFARVQTQARETAQIDFTAFPSPCFVLDESRLRRNLEIARFVQEQSGAKIILAFKGFSMWSAFGLVREYLPGATASSLNEAQRDTVLSRSDIPGAAAVGAALNANGKEIAHSAQVDSAAGR